MSAGDKATSIRLLDFKSAPMRAFHMTWFSFFICFFAWFGIAPLMGFVREELSLTRDQVGWCIIGSVAMTILSRLVIGWLCDRIGPRLVYTWLLILGSLPVIGIAFTYDFTTFLIARMLIGLIGASFVITQYHTSLMFASNCVGTANATTAGWGNLGGGVTQFAMPALFGLFVSTLGFGNSMGWRLSMATTGLFCIVAGIAYYFLTQDTPAGNFAELRAKGMMPEKRMVKGAFLEACRDSRVWALFIVYGACFGIELTINNIASLYFLDYFDYFKNLDPLKAAGIAGLIASSFGLMNLFARTLGGVFGDRFGAKWGLNGRVRWLFLTVFCEGLALLAFSQATTLLFALPLLIVFSLFVQMSEGATFSVVPFINKRALGSVSGIVGAGGNAGAVLAGFLFKAEAISWPTALFLLGILVTLASFATLLVQFEPATEAEEAGQPLPGVAGLAVES